MERPRILALLVASFYIVNIGESQASKPKIYYLEIKSYVRFRFATTLVTSKVTNPALYPQEYTFDVTLPNEAFITNFTLNIGGEIIVGEVKEKEAARQQYERAKERQESAAHIEVKPRETNKFNIHVNIAAEEKVIFNLTYQELLQRKHGVYNQVIYVNPGQPVNDLRIMVDIQESREITLLRVPPLRNDLLTDIDITATNEIATVQRPDSKSAFIEYSPTIEEQRKKSEQGLGGKFVVEYDVERENDQGDILIVNGYFIHFFAPEGGDIQPIPKDILFVLDVSGSMLGTKISQLKSAMHNILGDLEPNDRFNILTFSTTLKHWNEPGLASPSGFISASANNIDRASGFINRLNANSGTNINEALRKGLGLFAARTSKSRTPVIMFLTDGVPTSGLTSTDAILSNVKKLNTMKVSIFTLAFGTSANFNLCRQLALQNDGFARKIYEDSDADLQISGLYKEISTLLLRNVTFSYVNSNVDVDSLSKTDFPTYFNGTEIVIAGKLSNSADQTINALITATQGNTGIQIIVPGQVINSLGSDFEDEIKFDEITEKVWAYLTIKQHLTEMETEYDLEEKQKWKRKILEVSLKYNFVTPQTSMVVTLPEESEEIVVTDRFDISSDRRHVAKRMPNTRRTYTGMNQQPPAIPPQRAVHYPKLADTGNGYGIFFDEDRRHVAKRMPNTRRTYTGMNQHPPAIPPQRAVNYPKLADTGNRYGIVFDKDRRHVAKRMPNTRRTYTGMNQHPPAIPPQRAVNYPKLADTGNRYGIVFDKDPIRRRKGTTESNLGSIDSTRRRKAKRRRRRRRPVTPDIVVLVSLISEPLCMNIPKKLSDKTYNLLNDSRQELNISGKILSDGQPRKKRRSKPRLKQVTIDFTSGNGHHRHVVLGSRGSNMNSRAGNRKSTSHAFDGVTIKVVPVEGYLQVHLVFRENATTVNFDGLFGSLSNLSGVNSKGNRRTLRLTLSGRNLRAYQVPLVRHRLKTPFNMQSTNHTHCLYVKKRALIKALFPRSRILTARL